MGSEGDISQFTDSEIRRQRSDRISKLMSQDLLKGHRMLDSYCPSCNNILMEDKNGRRYCIGCEEVDKTGRKEHIPVHHVVTSVPQSSSPVINDDQCSTVAVLNEAKSTIVEKIRAVTKLLKEEETVNVCGEYASIIKVYAEALTAIDTAAKKQC